MLSKWVKPSTNEPLPAFQSMLYSPCLKDVTTQSEKMNIAWTPKMWGKTKLVCELHANRTDLCCSFCDNTYTRLICFIDVHLDKTKFLKTLLILQQKNRI